MRMSRTGNKRRGRNRKCNTNNAAQLNLALDWFLKDVSFRDFNPHGNTSWKPTALIIQTLLWIWSDKRNLTDAFDDSRLQSQKLSGNCRPDNLPRLGWSAANVDRSTSACVA